MTWLWLAVAAQIIFGASLVFDALLLRKKEIDPWPYVFWIGVFDLFSLALLPFGFSAPSSEAVIFALPAGVSFIAAIYFQYRALEESEASEAAPLISALSPLATLFFGFLILGAGLGAVESAGFFFLILGGWLVFLAEKKQGRPALIRNAGLSALCFGFSYVFAKLVYLETDFVTGFVLIRLSGALAVLTLFALSAGLSAKVRFSLKKNADVRKFEYVLNRIFAAFGAILFAGAIYLGNPALVDATTNLQYAVVFLLAWILLREHFRGGALIKKAFAIVLLVLGVGLLSLSQYAKSLPPVDQNRPIQWGVSFSQKFSESLELDWKANYQAVLNELRPEKLRLMAYWDTVEKTPGEFDFNDLDYQIAEAGKAGIPAVLAIGLKIPRWPECHVPDWAASLSIREREERLLDFIRRVVTRYRDNQRIEMWQVENEPYLDFGICPARGENFLDNEIKALKELDPYRPVLITDSGEVGEWLRSVSRGDVFGTSIYRKIYPRLIGSFTGIIEYPIEPSFFRVKEKVVRLLARAPEKKFIVHELQSEPWSDLPLLSVPLAEQIKIFSPSYFLATIEYAKETGFDEYHLWGAEWWYWMNVEQNDSRYWEIAKEIYNGNK